MPRGAARPTPKLSWRRAHLTRPVTPRACLQGESAHLLLALNTELNDARKALRFLTEQSFSFSAEELQLIGDTWCWPGKIKPKVEECQKRLKAERNRAEDELNMKRDKFIEELDDYVRQAEAFAAYGEIERVAENTMALNT